MWSLPPTLTIWPGFALDAAIEGDAAPDAAVEAGATVCAAPPHAATTSATTEATVASEVDLLLPITLLLSLSSSPSAAVGTFERGARRAALGWLSSSLSAALHSIAGR